MTLSSCATSLRAVSLVLLLAAPIALPLPAMAQDVTSAVWVPPPQSTRHEVRRSGIVTGVALLGIGYLGAAIWGSYYLGSRHLGVLGCNDLYGGFQFVPVVGSLIGMFAGGACVPDQLHIEEGIMPVVFTVPQLAGVIALIIGAIGHEVPDLPAVSLQMGGDGGTLTIGGSF